MKILEGEFAEGDRIVIDSDGGQIFLKKGEKR
jgi:hypothetical protein